MCVLLGFLQKTWAISAMNPLSWFMIGTEVVGILNSSRTQFTKPTVKYW